MEIRTKSVVLYTEGVYSAKEIGRMYNICDRTLRRWGAAYDNGGFPALQPKKTDPKKARHAIPKQLEQRIIRLKGQFLRGEQEG